MTFHKFCKNLWPEFTSHVDYSSGLMLKRPWAGPKDHRPNRKRRKKLYRQCAAVVGLR
jgi:hypothetical protein